MVPALLATASPSGIENPSAKASEGDHMTVDH
jgi:hypothetical protein